MYLEARINGKDISYIVDRRVTRSFMNPKLAKELGLQVQKTSKPVNMRFAKGKPLKTKEVASDVTLK